MKRLQRQRVPLAVRDETKSNERRHGQSRLGRRVDGALSRGARRVTPRVAHSDHVSAAVTRRHRQLDRARRTALSGGDGRGQPLTLVGRERRMTGLGYVFCAADLRTHCTHHQTVSRTITTVLRPFPGLPG